MTSAIPQADGLWPDILLSLTPITPEQLTDKHQPCPCCGGVDRYRWDSDDAAGSWFCNQCGGKNHSGGAGNGLDLLMRLNGLEFKDAVREVERHLGLTTREPSRTSAGHTVAVQRPSKPLKPRREPSAPPPEAEPPSLGSASAQYRYSDLDGRTLFFIQRLDKPDGRKLFVHRTWLDGGWHYPKRTDGFDSSWPAPRPLYRLDALKRQPFADVLVVEGEKAADAAARLLPDLAVVSWPNGSKAYDRVDWQPLAGRFVNLWPDNDDTGRAAMDAIGAKLVALGCTVKVVDTPTGSKDGWDVADAVWTPSEAIDYFTASRRPYVAPEAPSEPEPPQGGLDAPQPEFDLLGFNEDDYFYLPRKTGRVTRLAAASHTQTHLTRLAPLAFWQDAYPGPRGGVDWPQAVSDLYERQHAVGEFDPDLLRGRGAWWDANRSVLHLGDRLIVDGTEIPITVRFKSRFFYQRSIPLARMGGITPLSDPEAYSVITLAEQFYWDRPASALLLSGWCALAPICGALPWRPHIWLTAGAGSGKSAVLSRFISPLLGDLQLLAQGSTTEAFIRQHLKTDALPVVMDEAESNQRRDAERMQSILALARQASTESRAVQGRGSATGTTQVFRIRSMFLLASIATAIKGGADDRRFTQLTLTRPRDVDPALEAERWSRLKADLEDTLTEEFSHRLLARTVSLISQIRESIAVFSEVAAGHFGTQAMGDQYGCLLAGAWHLTSSDPASRSDAQSLIESADWRFYADNESVLPDEDACLQRILQAHLRVEGRGGSASDRTVRELIDVCLSPGTLSPLSPFDASDAEAALGREGIRVEEDTRHVLIANTAEGIRRILRDTPWATNWATILARCKGAERGVGTAWFIGCGSMRFVRLWALGETA